jgi:hypothetical protein
VGKIARRGVANFVVAMRDFAHAWTKFSALAKNDNVILPCRDIVVQRSKAVFFSSQ